MKKMVNMIAIFLVLFLSISSVSIYAATLNDVDVTTSKQTVHPGENVSVHVDFKTELGAYIVNVAYDNNLLDYVSAEGGTATDDGTRVKLVYYYNAGSGESPRTTASVTFKAKDNILTSNPTDLSVTLESMASPDASTRYDDMTTPIVKNIVVEPDYKDYDISLNYTGDVIENQEKDMKLVISSTMGKNYEHTRVLAQVATPAGETAKLLATDDTGLEHDIIDSGWGDPSGDAIGGKDVRKELNVRGLFSKAGDYTITFTLIDRDNSDAPIVTKSVPVTVKTENQTTPSQPAEGETQTPEAETAEEAVVKNTPKTLPKTGNTIYYAILPTIAGLAAGYVYLKRKD